MITQGKYYLLVLQQQQQQHDQQQQRLSQVPFKRLIWKGKKPLH